MNANFTPAERAAMSEAYWDLWNDEVQTQIDRDIEANRKSSACIKIEGLQAGTEVRVEQLAHDFVFGAHIFNYDQLGTDERNERYKELYGTLFNSATIGFYWKDFEPTEGKPRFQGEFRDSADYWNRIAEPKNEPHWRRPATDPVVEFCESKGIRLHGHTLTWGNGKWHTPPWIEDKFPSQYRTGDINHSMFHDSFRDLSPEQLEALLPEFTAELNRLMARRIIDIALYYKGRIHSWDIVNESAMDVESGALTSHGGLCKSRFGLMPGDHAYRSLKIAEGYFPDKVKLNINECVLSQAYVDQVNDLLARNCKVDIIGAQMHLFDPQVCRDIAAGKSQVRSPESVRETLARLSSIGRSIHLSEITISAPGTEYQDQVVQAVIARNLYRLWFSSQSVMGITWWNVVDECGAPGEPCYSGLFSRDMKPKPAYHALNQLINDEWKTKLTVKAAKDGLVEYRGFRGNYRLTWRDDSGEKQRRLVELR
jgi:GH35 family endo-1,4-beta-xylanase